MNFKKQNVKIFRRIKSIISDLVLLFNTVVNCMLIMYHRYIKKDYIKNLNSSKSEHKKPRKSFDNQNVNSIKELQASEPEAPIFNKIKSQIKG